MQVAQDTVAERKSSDSQAAGTGPATRPEADRTLAGRPWAVLRILLGAVFLWAFLDKTFGLGFATSPEKAWIAGGSPTAGYLGSMKGSLAGAFQALAGAPIVDWAFMVGLLCIGTALIFGVALRAAAVCGTALMALMWLSSLPLKSNPAIDEHVVYSAAMIALAASHAGDTWGLARPWTALTAAPALRWLR